MIPVLSPPVWISMLLSDTAPTVGDSHDLSTAADGGSWSEGRTPSVFMCASRMQSVADNIWDDQCIMTCKRSGRTRSWPICVTAWHLLEGLSTTAETCCGPDRLANDARQQHGPCHCDSDRSPCKAVSARHQPLELCCV
jgi:hypothetical protein